MFSRNKKSPSKKAPVVEEKPLYAQLLPFANVMTEKVQVVNINNGERIETYVIPGKKASGEITLNGPAARKVAKGDIVIIIAYATMDFEEAKRFEPSVIFPNETDNSLT